MSHLKDIHILAVDDEPDILESIEEILDESRVDRAMDYNTASEKIKKNDYDLAILDIMGVDGLKLLEECVERHIPSVMLTSHALNPENLAISLLKGALTYLPKEELSRLNDFLNELMGAIKKGDSPWKLLLKRFGRFFAISFGPEWAKNNNKYWEELLKKETEKTPFWGITK